jgi:hypothetical protein
MEKGVDEIRVDVAEFPRAGEMGDQHPDPNAQTPTYQAVVEQGNLVREPDVFHGNASGNLPENI